MHSCVCWPPEPWVSRVALNTASHPTERVLGYRCAHQPSCTGVLGTYTLVPMLYSLTHLPHLINMNFNDIVACYGNTNCNSLNYPIILNFWFYALLLCVYVMYVCVHVCINMFVCDLLLLLAVKRIEPRTSNIQVKHSLPEPYLQATLIAFLR